MIASDLFSFLQAWGADPNRVGAVAPSSNELATLMASEITPASGPVMELGPGTGVFTRALLARGVREEDVTLVECRHDFVQLLEMRFPEARVLRMDAGHLHRHSLFEDAPVGAVVSGLPLLNMSSKTVLSVLTGAFAHMRPDGAFYQFTYGPRCPVPKPFLERLGLQAKCIGGVLFNIPPATVYRINRVQTV